MKKSSIIFFQVMVVVLGACALAFLLVEPHFEGRNVNATFFEVYFKDAFLTYAYVTSITFFLGLYKIFKILGYLKSGKAISVPTANALQTVKRCAMFAIGFVVGGVVVLLSTESDDRPPIIAIGTIAVIASVAVAVVSAKYEQIVKTVLRV
jgi:Protein of unknown function (DUF2975)